MQVALARSALLDLYRGVTRDLCLKGVRTDILHAVPSRFLVAPTPARPLFVKLSMSMHACFISDLEHQIITDSK